MVFSEKLSALLSLTATKNVVIARALNIDTAQISRMKTGARGIPSNRQYVREIADFLAGRLDSEYKLSALSELTNDFRPTAGMSEAVLSGIIYDWLISDGIPETQTEKFVNQFGSYSVSEILEPAYDKENVPAPLDANGFAIFYKNEGKRQAVRHLINSAMSLSKPCNVRVFTDESNVWLLENSAFLRDISSAIQKATQKGCRIQRIQPPMLNTEGAFRSIEYWMPAYMTGSIKTFYYPWTRDELHRRTLIVVPGHCAIYSASLQGQSEAQMTFLISESSIVAAADEYYSSILERCRTMMSIYAADNKEQLLERLETMALIKDSGVYKSNGLSAHTLPSSALGHIRRRATAFTQQLLDTYSRNERYRIDTLRNHVITDIMRLPRLENVMNGIECIPITKISSADRLYYTPSEYRLHLKHIIWYLETFPNYQAILTSSTTQNDVVIYTKGDDHALMIKESEPYTLFEITERTFASSLCNYLRTMAAENIAPGSRRETIEQLKSELSRLELLIPMPLQ